MKKAITYIVTGLIIVGIGLETGIILMQCNLITSQNITIDNQKITINGQKDKINTIDKTNEQEGKKLAEKIIIQSYNEFSKAGKLTRADNILYTLQIQNIIENMKLVSNSYNGNDVDISNMLLLISKYLDYNYSIDYNSISNEVKTAYINQILLDYRNADDAVRKCISKYALFGKVGLNK